MTGRLKKFGEDKTSTDVLRLPEIGKIKVGKIQTYDDPNKKDHPISLDYFRATGNYAEMFHANIGKEPKILRIMFISDDPNTSCREFMELRNHQGKVFASGDGEVFQAYDLQEKKMIEKRVEEMTEAAQGKLMDKILADCLSMASTEKQKSQIEWKHKAALRFIIMAPEQNSRKWAIPVTGHWHFETKGKKSSIRELIGTFDTIQSGAGGSILNIVFQLRVQMHVSDTMDKRRYPVVTMVAEIPPEAIAALGEKREKLKQLGPLSHITEEMIFDESRMIGSSLESPGEIKGEWKETEYQDFEEVEESKSPFAEYTVEDVIEHLNRLPEQDKHLLKEIVVDSGHGKDAKVRDAFIKAAKRLKVNYKKS